MLIDVFADVSVCVVVCADPFFVTDDGPYYG